MISKLTLIIFIVICVNIVFCLNRGFALPTYKNYNFTDLLTTKFKLGNLIGKTEVKDLNLVINEKGLSSSFEVNPLYNIHYLNLLYIGFSADSCLNKNFRTNLALLSIGYYFPILPSSLDFVAGVNLYLTSGLGFRYIHIHSNTNEEFSSIRKHASIKSLAFGAEIYPKSLKYYKIAFYLEFKNIYSDYSVTVYNIKNSNNYKNSFVTVGFLYKTNYLIK